MNLYEISNNYVELFDKLAWVESDACGLTDDERAKEITNVIYALDSLDETKDVKVENIALYVKSRRAFADAIKGEVKKLTTRLRIVENQAKRTERYLSDFLGGESFESAKVRIGYRKSTSVEVTDEELLPENYLEKTYKVLKKEIKDDLKLGTVITGAYLKNHVNIQIK